MPTNQSPSGQGSTVSEPKTAHIPRQSKLPEQFLNVLQPGDVEWVEDVLLTGGDKKVFRETFDRNWYQPPSAPPVSSDANSPPNPDDYFRRRLYVWAPKRMWNIPLECPTSGCKLPLGKAGMYRRLRVVLDYDDRYYLAGEYLTCTSHGPIPAWHSGVLAQLSPVHRNRFPVVFSTRQAMDRRCVTLMKPRTLGNSSAYAQQVLEEVHSEAWARNCIEYLEACIKHKNGLQLLQKGAIKYSAPPPYQPVPGAQWFETIHSNDVLRELDRLKGAITGTFGNILKIDSTKKVLLLVID